MLAAEEASGKRVLSSKEKESSEKGEKSSIMNRLKAAKTNKPQDKPAPQKEKKSERDL